MSDEEGTIEGHAIKSVTIPYDVWARISTLKTVRNQPSMAAAIELALDAYDAAQSGPAK